MMLPGEAAGRTERVPRRDDARTDDIASLDRLLQADVGPFARADDPDGREAAVPRPFSKGLHKVRESGGT